MSSMPCACSTAVVSRPDRSAAGHEHPVVGRRAREVHRVDRDRGRLGERGGARRERVGDDEQLLGGGHLVTGEGAAESTGGRRGPPQAHRRPAPHARAALTAPGVGPAHHPLRRPPSLSTSAPTAAIVPAHSWPSTEPGRAIRSSTRCRSVPQIPQCETSTSTSAGPELRNRHVVHLDRAVADVDAGRHELHRCGPLTACRATLATSGAGRRQPRSAPRIGPTRAL